MNITRNNAIFTWAKCINFTSPMNAVNGITNIIRNTQAKPISCNPTSLTRSHAISKEIKQISQFSISISIEANYSTNKICSMAAAAALGITIVTLNTTDCATNSQEKIKEFVLSNVCEHVLQLILGLSNISAGILASILEPQMLGDPETEIFQKERLARGAAIQQEAKKHLSKIETLSKNANLSISHMDIIKSICPLDKEPGLLFFGRYVPYSQLYAAIQKAQKIGEQKK